MPEGERASHRARTHRCCLPRLLFNLYLAGREPCSVLFFINRYENEFQILTE